MKQRCFPQLLRQTGSSGNTRVSERTQYGYSALHATCGLT